MGYKAASTYQLASGTADVAAVPAPPTPNQPAIRLMGFSIREAAGTPAVATVIIRNGTADTGAILAVIELAADASINLWFGPEGIDASLGIFVDRVAGTTQGAIYYRYAEEG